MKISMTLSPNSIDKALTQLKEYRDGLQDKAQKIAEQLAAIGGVNVSVMFSQAIYDDGNDVSVSVEETEGGYAIKASGQTVLFVEFGAGARYGYGHPQAAEFGYGPGTYNPSSGNWNNPKGWWYSVGGKQRRHTYGNPPNMAMYNTAKDLREEIERIAREVFGT